MTQMLAWLQQDVPVAIAVAIGPLGRARPTAPLIERLLHIVEVAMARESWPACARALGDRAESIAIGIPEARLDPRVVMVSGPWSRSEAAHCTRLDGRIKMVGDRTIALHLSSNTTRGLDEVLASLPADSTLRVRVTMVLDRVSARAELIAPDEPTAQILETRARGLLGIAQVPGSSIVLARAGSRLQLDVDAGPTMLRMIESALP